MYHYQKTTSFRKKKRVLPKILFFLIFAAFIVLFGAYKFYKNSIYLPFDTKNTSAVVFQIKEGQTVKEIAKNLKEKDLIKNASTFYYYTKTNNLGEEILSGRFKLNRSMNVPEIINTLKTRPDTEILIIYEGQNIKELDKTLSDMTLISQGEIISAVKNFNGWEFYPFLNQEQQNSLEIPLEGYIYPDTYFFDFANFKPEQVIYKAMDNFEKKLELIHPQSSPKSVKEAIDESGKSLQEIIIMASIIEDEVFGFEDRKLVSGIYWKRLAHNWTLGADATLLYITNSKKITAQDLKIDSPYNTRIHKGLPPGPICNPSLESIIAAIYPKESDYWFYLNTPDTGKTIFAKTNEEHNANRAKYL